MVLASPSVFPMQLFSAILWFTKLLRITVMVHLFLTSHIIEPSFLDLWSTSGVGRVALLSLILRVRDLFKSLSICMSNSNSDASLSKHH